MTFREVRVSLIFCFFFALAGCASEAKYEAKLNSWVGQDEIKLVRLWGPPERTYEAGDSKFLQYSFGNTLVLPGTPSTASTTFNGNAAFTTINPGVQPQGIEYNCATTFEIKAAKVVDWANRGNGCVSE